MRNSNPDIVEVIMDGVRVMFRCKDCGQVWLPSIKPESHGRLYRGSWQCPNGCK
jgi:uncharacterized Zn finger protein